MAELFYNGLVESGTFLVDTTLKNTIGTDFDSVVNKVVALTDNEPRVGYGKAGDMVFGVITKAEYLDNSKEDIVVTVERRRTFEDVDCASGLTFGKGLVCDGKGGVKAVETEGGSPVTAFSMSVTGTKALIWVL